MINTVNFNILIHSTFYFFSLFKHILNKEKVAFTYPIHK